jgi:hypothetical protein
MTALESAIRDPQPSRPPNRSESIIARRCKCAGYRGGLGFSPYSSPMSKIESRSRPKSVKLDSSASSSEQSISGFAAAFSALRREGFHRRVKLSTREGSAFVVIKGHESRGDRLDALLQPERLAVLIDGATLHLSTIEFITLR